jgi:hypothetical protein
VASVGRTSSVKFKIVEPTPSQRFTSNFVPDSFHVNVLFGGKKIGWLQAAYICGLSAVDVDFCCPRELQWQVRVWPCAVGDSLHLHRVWPCAVGDSLHLHRGWPCAVVDSLHLHRGRPCAVVDSLHLHRGRPCAVGDSLHLHRTPTCPVQSEIRGMLLTLGNHCFLSNPFPLAVHRSFCRPRYIF